MSAYLNVNASESLFILGCFMVFICVFGFVSYHILNSLFQVFSMDYREVKRLHGEALKAFSVTGSVNGMIFRGFKFNVDVYNKFFVVSIFNHAVVIDNLNFVVFKKGLFNIIKIKKYNDKMQFNLNKKDFEFLETWSRSILENEKIVERVI